MTDPVDNRRNPDRRRHARGGRREADVQGYTPLVFVVDSRPRGREACEAILAKLRFAVAPFDSLDQAKRALKGLKPDVVLVAGEYFDEMRRELPPSRHGGPLPLLALPDGDLSSMALVEDIRRALRVDMVEPSDV
jgi:hypothetical protein